MWKSCAIGLIVEAIGETFIEITASSPLRLELYTIVGEDKELFTLERHVNPSTSQLVFDQLSPRTLYKLVAVDLSDLTANVPKRDFVVFHTLSSFEIHRLCRLTEKTASVNWIRPRFELPYFATNVLIPQEGKVNGGVELTLFQHDVVGNVIPKQGTFKKQVRIRHEDLELSSQSTFQFTDLKELTVYTLRIRGWDSARGFGMFSEACCFMTLSPEVVTPSESTHCSFHFFKSRQVEADMIKQFQQTHGRLRYLRQYSTGSDDVAKYIVTVKSLWEDNLALKAAAEAEFQQVTQLLEVSQLNAALIMGNDDLSAEDRRASQRRKNEVSAILEVQRRKQQILKTKLDCPVIQEVTRTLEPKWTEFEILDLTPSTHFHILFSAMKDGETFDVVAFELETKSAADSDFVKSIIRDLDDSIFGADDQYDTRYLTRMLSTNLCQYLTVEHVLDHCVTISWSPVDFEEIARQLLEDTEDYEQEAVNGAKELCEVAERMCDRRIRVEYCVALRKVENAETVGQRHKTKQPMTLLKRVRESIGGALTVFLSGNARAPPDLPTTTIPLLQDEASEEQRIVTHLHNHTLIGLLPNTMYDLQLAMYCSMTNTWHTPSQITRFCTLDTPAVEIVSFPNSLELKQNVMCRVEEAAVFKWEMYHRQAGTAAFNRFLPRHTVPLTSLCGVEFRLTALVDESDEGMEENIKEKIVSIRVCSLRDAHKGITFKHLQPNVVHKLVARRIIAGGNDETSEKKRQDVFCSPGPCTFFSFRCLQVKIFDVEPSSLKIRVNVPTVASQTNTPLMFATVLHGDGQDPLRRQLSFEDSVVVVETSHEDRIVAQALIAQCFDHDEASAAEDMKQKWKPAQASISVASQCSILPFSVTDCYFEFCVVFFDCGQNLSLLHLDSQTEEECSKHLRRFSSASTEVTDHTLETMKVEVAFVALPPFPEECELEMESWLSQTAASFFEKEELVHTEKQTAIGGMIRINELNSNTAYVVRIRPLMWSSEEGDESYGVWSRWIHFKTADLIDITLEEITETSLTVSCHRGGVTEMKGSQMVAPDPRSVQFGSVLGDLLRFVYRHVQLGAYRIKWKEFYGKHWQDLDVSSTLTTLNGLSPNTQYIVKVQQLPLFEETSRSSLAATSTTMNTSFRNSDTFRSMSVSSAHLTQTFAGLAWSRCALCFRTTGELCLLQITASPDESCTVRIGREGAGHLTMEQQVDEEGTPLLAVEGERSSVCALQLRVFRDYEGSDKVFDVRKEEPLPLPSQSVEASQYWARLQRAKEVPWFISGSPVPFHEGTVNLAQIIPTSDGLLYVNLVPNKSNEYIFTNLKRSTAYAFQMRSLQVEGANPSTWSPTMVHITRSPPILQLSSASEFFAELEWIPPPECSFLDKDRALVSGIQMEVLGHFYIPQNELQKQTSRKNTPTTYDKAGRAFQLNSQIIFRSMGTCRTLPIKHLMPGSFYCVQIRCFYGDEIGPASSLCIFQSVPALQIALHHFGERHAIVFVERNVDVFAEKAALQELTREGKKLSVKFLKLPQPHELPQVEVARFTVSDSKFEFKIIDVSQSTAKRTVRPTPFVQPLKDSSFFLIDNLEPNRTYSATVRSIVAEKESNQDLSNEWSKATSFHTAPSLVMEVLVCSETCIGVGLKKNRLDQSITRGTAITKELVEKCEHELYHVCLMGDEGMKESSTFSELTLHFASQNVLFQGLVSGCTYVVRCRSVIPLNRFVDGLSDSESPWFTLGVMCTAPHQPSCPTLYECRDGYLSFFWNFSKEDSSVFQELLSPFPPSTTFTPSIVSEETLNANFELSNELKRRRVHSVACCPQPKLADVNSVSNWAVVCRCRDHYNHSEYETCSVKYVIEAATGTWRATSLELSEFETVEETTSQLARCRLESRGQIPITSLFFRIMAIMETEQGHRMICSKWSAAYSFEAPPPLQSPRNLELILSSGSSVALRWLPSDNWHCHNQVHYKIDVCRTSCGLEWKTFLLLKHGNSCVLHPLCLGETYKARVTAISSFGTGGTTHSLIFTTPSRFIDLPGDIFAEYMPQSAIITQSDQKFPFTCDLVDDASPPPRPTPFHKEFGRASLWSYTSIVQDRPAAGKATFQLSFFGVQAIAEKEQQVRIPTPPPAAEERKGTRRPPRKTLV